MLIKIILEDNEGKMICRGDSLSFETAHEELYKLERYVTKLDLTKQEDGQ